MKQGDGSSLPFPLRQLWETCDPASTRSRYCDPLDRDTPHRRLATAGGDYWLCSNTGQLHADTFIDPDGSHYDPHWQRVIALNEFDQDVERHRGRLAPYEPFRRTGWLFEVASGNGSLLKAAIDMGWQVEGNEISSVAATYAHETTGALVHHCPMEQLELTPGRFDVIICKDVFEHLDAPRETMIRLARGLRPGGAIYLHTLNGQSLSLYFRPHDWQYFNPGHHFVPSLVSMGEYCRAAGLTAAKMTTHGLRLRPRDDAGNRSRLLKLREKLLAAAASPMRLGHRMECRLERLDDASATAS